MINGQKTWTTLAQYADWIFVLARTDASVKKQEGISFFLVDMKTPGVTVRPIQTIDGGFEVNEVFFDNVRIPLDNIVGQENKGWDYAKFLLSNERNGIARVGISKARLAKIRRLAEIPTYGDKPKMADPGVPHEARRGRGRAEGARDDADARHRGRLQGERGKPNPMSSVLKIKGSEIQQATTELLMDVVGPYALPFEPEREDGERWNEPPVGPDWASTHRSDLLQRAQGFDLRRLERDPARDHRQGYFGALRRWTFDLSEEQRLISDSVARLMKERYGFEQRKAYARKPARLFRGAVARNTPSSACSARSFAEEDGGFGGGAVEIMLIAGGVRPRAGARALYGDGRARRRRAAPRRERRAAAGADRRDRRGRVAACARPRRARLGLESVRRRRRRARKDGASYVLNGEKGLVLHGDSAQKLIVLARTARRAARQGRARPVPRRRLGARASRGAAMRRRTVSAPRKSGLINVRVDPENVIGDPEGAGAVIERDASTRRSRRFQPRASAR